MRRALIGVFALGLLLRAIGCFGQGLPYGYYGDEDFNARQALKFGAEKTLDPAWFNKPSLGYYVLFAEYGAYYAVGKATGRFETPEDFAQHYFDRPGNFYLIGRLSTALFGAFTVLLVYRLAKELRSRAHGLIAALALALTMGHLSSSQHLKMDVPSTFFTVWASLACLRVMTRGERRHYLWAGILTGLGTATKYYSVVLFVPFLFAHVFREPLARQRHPRVWTSGRVGLGILGWLGGFFVGAPYCFLNPLFWESWLRPQLSFALRQTGQDWLSDLICGSFFLQTRGSTVDHDRGATLWDAAEVMAQTFASQGAVGPVIFAFAILGVLALLLRPRRRGAFLLLIIATTAALLAIGNRQFSESRHLNTLFPFSAILASYGLLSVARLKPLRRIRGRVLAGLLLVLIGPYPGGPLWEVVAHDREQLEADPRNRALAWIHENVPPGSTIMNDHERLPLRSTLERLRWSEKRVRHLIEVNAFRRGWNDSYEIQLRLKLKAAERWGENRYDVICLLHPWQVESLVKRPSAAVGYNPIWPRSPWGGLWDRMVHEHHKDIVPLESAAQVAARYHELLPEEFKQRNPVEHWSRPSAVSFAYLLRHPEKGPGWDQWSCPEWFVSAEASYENYLSPHKRRNFPDFAAFYDDLKAHYDCHEFRGPPGEHEKTVRIWDLRRRIEDRAPTVTRH